jgi:hypothetical protein
VVVGAVELPQFVRDLKRLLALVIALAKAPNNALEN